MHYSRDLEAALAEPLGSWKFRDIDWKFVFGAQHYGTAVTTLAILIALVVVHWTLNATQRVFFLYDATISYVSHGDTVPAWVAVIVPLVCFLISLISYEFIVYRRYSPCTLCLARPSTKQVQGLVCLPALLWLQMQLQFCTGILPVKNLPKLDHK